MPSVGKCYVGTIGVVLLLSAAAWAGDFLIVPGQRIGAVKLGMSRQAVHRALHAPDRARRIPGGIVQESWLSRRKFSQADRDNGIYWKWNFVTIDFERNRVIQIEVNSPRFATSSHLSTLNSATDWGKRYGPVRSKRDRGGNRHPDGAPGAHHFMLYIDAVQQGIAWRYGAWGDLSPEPDPDEPVELVIVHFRKGRLIPDPDGSNRFVISSADER
jgi:hypothetical protein